MSVLPSPIPHPLDYSPWDLPGWAYEAIEWVVGFDWPEGDEKATWDLADQWYDLVDSIAGPGQDATEAAGRFIAAYGGSGTTIDAFVAAWTEVADGEEAPLNALVAFAAELGRVVDECAQDLEAAKLEAWIELGLFVIELIGLAVTVALTLGAASPAAGGLIAATRMAIQQIFKRLIAQLSKKAMTAAVKETAKRAGKELLTRKGLQNLGKKALQEGRAEAREEFLTTLGIQAYQVATGHSSGFDLTDLGTSALAGAAGGVAAHGATVGADRKGGGLFRGAAGEVLGELGGSAASGRLPSFEDLAKAGTSGASGSAVDGTREAFSSFGANFDADLKAGGVTAAAASPGSAPSSGFAASSGTGGSFAPAGPAEGAPPAGGSSVPIPPGGTPSSTGGVPPSTGGVPSSTGGVPPSTGGVPSSTGGVPPSTGGVPSSTGDTVSSTGGVTLSAVAPPVEALTGTAPDAGMPSPTPVSPFSSPTAAPSPASPFVSPLPASPLPASPLPAPPLPTSPARLVDPVIPTGAATASLTTAPPATTAPPSSTALPASTVPPTSTVPPAGPATPGTAPSTRPTPTGTTSPTAPNTATHGGTPLPNTAAPGANAPGKTTPTNTVQTDAVQTDAVQTGTVQTDLDNGRPARRTARIDPIDDPLSVLDPDNNARLVEPVPVPAPPGAAELDAADARARENYLYEGHQRRQHLADTHRRVTAQELRRQSRNRALEAEDLISGANRGDRTDRAAAEIEANRLQTEADDLLDQARLVESDGPIGDVQVTGNDWELVNDSASDLAPGPVETDDRSCLTGDDHPPSADRSRPYHRRGGLRPPLKVHQTDLERAMPRDRDGTVIRHADPREGNWFGLQNDGGPEADPTRSNNCGDTVLSLYETYLHARPRVSAPRTFDGYRDGDPSRPTGAEIGVTARIEDTVGGRFEGLFDVGSLDPDEARVQVRMVEIGLRTHLTSLGHGAFAFLLTQDQAGRTHAIAAVNQNGTILYLDPQSRRVSTFPIQTHSGLDVPCDVVRMDALIVNGQAALSPMTAGAVSFVSADPSGADPGDRTDDAELEDKMRRYELLGDLAPRIDIIENDRRYKDHGAHTITRHGPDVELYRDFENAADPTIGPADKKRTIEGRIYGDHPWKRPENKSFKWYDDGTMRREIEEYINSNWEDIRSDLVLEGSHVGHYDAGRRVGHGFYNKGAYGSGPRQAEYGQTSWVKILIRLVDDSEPPEFFILTSYPAG